MQHTENQLIASLPKQLQKRFLALCDPFDLEVAADLSVRGDPLSHAYFPCTGFIALMLDADSHPPFQVGMLGAESMLGLELILGAAKTPWSSIVQGAGTCWRIEACDLRKASADMPALKELLERALTIRLHQMSLALSCERFHSLSQRLARWMLMVSDRTQSTQFHVTHEFVSTMLGVRREGVTQAAGTFHTQGFIEYHRGELWMLSRKGLEGAACSCYKADKLLFTELMSDWREGDGPTSGGQFKPGVIHS